MLKKQFLILLFGAALFALPCIHAMEEWSLDKPQTTEVAESAKKNETHPLNDNDSVTIQLAQSIARIDHQRFEQEKEYDEKIFIIEGNDVDAVKDYFIVPYHIIKNCKVLCKFIVTTSHNTGEITFSENIAHNFELLKRVRPLLEILADATTTQPEKEQQLTEILSKTTKHELLALLDFANYLNCRPLYDFFIALMHQKLQNLLFKEPSIVGKTYNFVQWKDKHILLKKALNCAHILESSDHNDQLFNFACKNGQPAIVFKQKKGHTDFVISYYFSPRGNNFIVTDDGTVCIYMFYDLKKDSTLSTVLFLEYLMHHTNQGTLQQLPSEPLYFDLYLQIPEIFQVRFVSAIDQDALKAYLENKIEHKCLQM